MTNKEQLLYDINIVSFVLVDLGLYLDTHPNDKSAIEYYNHYAKIKHQMTMEFSMKYYPLTMECTESNKEWRWGCAPLPWEGGCI
jgi:spore coat protein JB